MSFLNFGFRREKRILEIPTIKRANLLTDSERYTYSTELIDTYNEFGLKYIKIKLKQTVKTELVKEGLSNLALCFPLLKDFINQISMVYRKQPIRNFYLNGKLIVPKLPKDTQFINTDKYYEDENLYNILTNIYNREFCLRIKEAEIQTNLLSTTIYKINNQNDTLILDFVPNDITSIIANIDNQKKMDVIKYQLGIENINLQSTTILYEYWTPEKMERLKNNKIIYTTENEAVKELQNYTNNSKNVYIGDGFPPFVVLRNNLTNLDFWNITGRDIIELIKDINIAFTELRYLQRYGSFGLKYILNGKVSSDRPIDLIGIQEFETQNAAPTSTKDSNDTKIGEFKNEGRLEDLGESIFKMIQFLYSLRNISVERLVTTKQATTAESKKIDQESIQKYIEKQQEIWAINEENIFNTAIVVYNRDNTNKLPQGLSISIDFYDAKQNAEERAKEIENWLVLVDNNIKTKIDWLMADNPDLDEDEAQLTYDKNKTINESENMQSSKDEIFDNENNEDEDEEKNE